MLRLKKLALASLAGCLLAGCSVWRVTDTPRTSVEQLLLSTATDRAVAKMDFTRLNEVAVYLDGTFAESYDEEYVIGSIRDRLGRDGAYVVDDKTKAKIIIELRIGSLANDHTDFLLGIPSIAVPIPGAGVINTPEVMIFKRLEQEAVAKFSLYGRRQTDGSLVLSTGPKSGTASYHRWGLLFIPFKSTDIPELSK